MGEVSGVSQNKPAAAAGAGTVARPQNNDWKRVIDNAVSNIGVETNEDNIYGNALALLQVAAKSPEQAKYVTDKVSMFLADYKIPENFSSEQRYLYESRYNAAMDVLSNIHDGKLPGPDFYKQDDNWKSDMYLKPEARKAKAPEVKAFDYSGKNSALRDSMNNIIVDSFKLLAEKAPLANISIQAHNQLYDWKISGYDQIVD